MTYLRFSEKIRSLLAVLLLTSAQWLESDAKVYFKFNLLFSLKIFLRSQSCENSISDLDLYFYKTCWEIMC